MFTAIDLLKTVRHFSVIQDSFIQKCFDKIKIMGDEVFIIIFIYLLFFIYRVYHLFAISAGLDTYTGGKTN